MGKILLVLMFVAGLVSSNDHLNLFENTQKLSNISSVDAPQVKELDQRKLRLMCEGKMAACFRADQPNTIFIDKTLPKEIKSLTLVGIYADYLTYNPDQISISYAGLNEGRLPAYHRLDINISRTFELEDKGSIDFTAGVTNVYSRENVFYINRLTGQRKNQLPFLPSVSIDWKF